MTPATPTHKTYYFTPCNDRVKAVTSPSIRMRSKGTIYFIWHIESGEAYVGKTTDVFSNRIHKHVFNANHPEKVAGQRKVARALRRSPRKFRFRVLKKNIKASELGYWERKYIAELNPSLNMASGGGGGVASSKKKSDTAKVEIFTTPKKHYPVTMYKGRVKVILTPTARSRRNVVYVFKNKRNGKRLIGRTGQIVANRVYQYHWVINSEKSDERDRDFVKDIKQNPEDFSFGVLATSNTPSNLDFLEKKCIKKKAPLDKRYNRNAGGGGSTVSRKLNFG